MAIDLSHHDISLYTMHVAYRYQSQFQGLPSPKEELADNRRAGGRATNARGHGLGNVGRGERLCQEEQEGKHVSSSATAGAAATSTTSATTHI